MADEHLLNVRGRMRQEVGDNYIIMSFMIRALYDILLWRSNRGSLDGQGMWHTWERREVLKKLWSVKLKGRERWENLGADI
jgi:hypothetical protein